MASEVNKFDALARTAHEKLVHMKCTTLVLCQNLFLEVNPHNEFKDITHIIPKINTHMTNESNNVRNWFIEQSLEVDGLDRSPVIEQSLAILSKLSEWICLILKKIPEELKITLDNIRTKPIDDAKVVTDAWCESWPKIVQTAGEDPVPPLEFFLQKVNAK